MGGVEIFPQAVHRLDGAGDHGEETLVGVKVLFAIPVLAGRAEIEGQEKDDDEGCFV